ncbi:MAG: hypothetical protein ABFR32_13085 [Bacteroidota bacterium]
MKELSFEKLENLEGGKFWGWGPETCVTSYDSVGSCTTCTSHYYALWINVSTNVDVSCTHNGIQ